MNILLVGLLTASLATSSLVSAGSSKATTRSLTADTRTEKMTSYGAGVKSKARMPLAQAVAEKKFNTSIALTATVAEVCQVKGCWMILVDGDTKVRVTFKDYGFFMPKDLAGAKVVVEGVLSEEVLSEKDARHYAEDAGKSKAEIAKIKGDQRELGFEATGVLAPKK
jgi:hypothetical protein